MGFSAPEESGDPDSHFVCPACQSTLICVKEAVHVFVQLFCNNILIQLLIDILFILLTDFDDAVDFAVNAFIKHVFNDHGPSS